MYIQASMELVSEDVSLLERCPHFRGCYVQVSMDMRPAYMYMSCTLGLHVPRPI